MARGTQFVALLAVLALPVGAALAGALIADSPEPEIVPYVRIGELSPLDVVTKSEPSPSPAPSGRSTSSTT